MSASSSWAFSRQTLHLTLAVTFGAVSATTLIFTSIAVRRRIATEALKASIPPISPTHHADPLTEYGGAAEHETLSSKEDQRAAKIAVKARRGEYDEELILEQLTRTRAFLTDEGLKQVRDAFVVVVGLGGVGSHAVTALARSGVSRIRVVDFDQVTLSSLNRHAVATLADVGTPKVHCVRKRLEQIAPWCRIEARNELFGNEAADRLLGEWGYDVRDGEEGDKPDFVLDCIDNIDSKVGLLAYCHQHSVKVVSAMGAGCKSDPTRICVGDISSSIEDPLSKATRRRLRILGIKEGIPVVFSTEKPGPGKAALLPVNAEEIEKGEVEKLGVLPDFRVRILPVLGTMPAVFGYTVANHVICDIGGYPMDYRVGDKGRDKMYEGMLSALQGSEERLTGGMNGQDVRGLRIPLSVTEVGYLVEEVFRGKSVVSGLTNRLALVRWRKPEDGFKQVLTYEEDGQKSVKLGLGDLVLMTKEEAQKHEKEVLKGEKAPEEFYYSTVLDTVKRRHTEEMAFDKYR